MNRNLFARLAAIVATLLSAQLRACGDQPQAEPDGLVKLSKTGDVWLDTKRKAVVVDGQVCLREGQLEMFACPKGTKEHESIISLNSKAEEVHAGLLAAGAKPGSPVTTSRASRRR